LATAAATHTAELFSQPTRQIPSVQPAAVSAYMSPSKRTAGC
jgi:hypothetical protein